MTKKEIINTLVNEYGVEDKGLAKKTIKELEQMLDELKNKVEEVKEVTTEELDEAVTNVKPEKSEEKKKEVVTEVQPNVYETITRRFEPAKDIRIENLGAGDVFISKTKENLVNEKNKIAPGQVIALKDVSVLYITSASRPIIRIIY
jgi:nucleoid DNA-binding protein